MPITYIPDNTNEELNRALANLAQVILAKKQEKDRLAQHEKERAEDRAERAETRSTARGGQLVELYAKAAVLPPSQQNSIITALEQLPPEQLKEVFGVDKVPTITNPDGTRVFAPNALAEKRAETEVAREDEALKAQRLANEKVIQDRKAAKAAVYADLGNQFIKPAGVSDDELASHLVGEIDLPPEKRPLAKSKGALALQELADKYGVSPSAVSAVMRKMDWIDPQARDSLAFKIGTAQLEQLGYENRVWKAKAAEAEAGGGEPIPPGARITATSEMTEQIKSAGEVIERLRVKTPNKGIVALHPDAQEALIPSPSGADRAALKRLADWERAQGNPILYITDAVLADPDSPAALKSILQAGVIRTGAEADPKAYATWKKAPKIDPATQLYEYVERAGVLVEFEPRGTTTAAERVPTLLSAPRLGVAAQRRNLTGSTAPVQLGSEPPSAAPTGGVAPQANPALMDPLMKGVLKKRGTLAPALDKTEAAAKQTIEGKPGAPTVAEVEAVRKEAKRLSDLANSLRVR